MAISQLNPAELYPITIGKPLVDRHRQSALCFRLSPKNFQGRLLYKMNILTAEDYTAAPLNRQIIHYIGIGKHHRNGSSTCQPIDEFPNLLIYLNLTSRTRAVVMNC